MGGSFRGKPVTYVEQAEQLGTGHALLQADGKAGKKFFVFMGDDMYDKSCFEKLAVHENAVLGQKVPDPSNFGVLTHNKGKLEGVIEKSPNPPSSLANAALYVFTDKVFDELKTIKKSPRGEIELTDALMSLARKGKVTCVETDEGWRPVTFPWSLLAANEKKIKTMKGSVGKSATVEKGAVLKGEVFVGAGSVIKSGAYIEGPVCIGADCTIGPNCYIRAGTVLGDKCYVGNAVEIKNSVYFGSTHTGHLSYVGDSIIGENCNLAAGTITANLRFDDAHVKATIKGEKMSTGRRKMGVIMGDNVKTGINVSIMPGVCVSSGKWIGPHQLVEKDI